MPNSQDNQDWVFQGFNDPNTTAVPDAFFDVLAPLLKEGELRVLLYMIRRTYGFKKSQDDISLSQLTNGITTRDGRVLDRGTGMGKPAVIRAIRSLESHKVIIKTPNQSAARGFETTSYRLNRIEAMPVVEPVTPPLFSKDTRGASISKEPALVSLENLQETGLQQTENTLSDIQKSNSSNNKKPDQTVSNRNGRASHENPPEEIEAKSVQPTVYRGMESVGESLQRRLAVVATDKLNSDQSQPGRRRKRMPETLSHDEYDNLIRMMKDYARQNGGADEYNSHVTHACNIIEQSGCSYSTFYGAAIEAQRQLTARRMKSQVEKPMAYWFVCLETELGLRPRHNSATAPN